jgi:hypothetical protein
MAYSDKEYEREYQRKYRAANRQALCEQKKAHREANKEHYRRISREKYLATKQSVQERSRAWYYANREKVRIVSSNRKARVYGAEGSFTMEDVKAIWVRQGMKCAVPGCTHPISDKTGDRNVYHIDHIKPCTRGGSNWPSNLQILCSYHNVQKSNRDEQEWAQRHGISLEKRENDERENS